MKCPRCEEEAQTDWERKTLLGDGFHAETSRPNVYWEYLSTATKYVVSTAQHGGVG